MVAGLESLCSLGPTLSFTVPTCLPAGFYLQQVIVSLVYVWELGNPQMAHCSASPSPALNSTALNFGLCAPQTSDSSLQQNHM